MQQQDERLNCHWNKPKCPPASAWVMGTEMDRLSYRSIKEVKQIADYNEEILHHEYRSRAGPPTCDYVDSLA
jgi:hypothetical protein